MSIHHLDTVRYWAGAIPNRVDGRSTRPILRTKFSHDDGINSLHSPNLPAALGHRAGTNVWGRTGARKGPGRRSRFAGAWREPKGSPFGQRSVGPAGLLAFPVPHRLFHERRPGDVASPAVARSVVSRRLRRQPMGGLLHALETGDEPDISGRDNLKDDRPL